jgi:hypothetical protein
MKSLVAFGYAGWALGQLETSLPIMRGTRPPRTHSGRLLVRLLDIESFDLSGRSELEFEIGIEVSPAVGMKAPEQVGTMAFNAIDRRESATRLAVVESFASVENCEAHASLSLLCSASIAVRTVGFVSLALSTIRLQSNGSAHQVRCLVTQGCGQNAPVVIQAWISWPSSARR